MVFSKLLKQCGLSMLLFLVIVSCNDLGRDDFDAMLSELEVSKLPSKTDYVIIIPGQGCSGCLQAARIFMSNNFSDDRFTFILTKFDSQSQIRIMYGSEALQFAILDRSDVFYNGGFNSMYPTIITVSGGSQFKVRLADPDHYHLWEEIIEF